MKFPPKIMDKFHTILICKAFMNSSHENAKKLFKNLSVMLR
jgi:hypothetical protein